MAFKHSPGCRCCSETCDIAADTFDGVSMPPLPGWTQVSGAWSSTGGGVSADGYLTTTDDDALIRHDTAHPDWLAEQWVSVKMQTSAAGDRLRIILAYNPTTLTYLVVEIEFGVNDGMLRFYEFKGYGLTQLGPDVPLMTTLNTWYTVIACYHDGTITAIFTDLDYREIVQYRAATADGYLVGLGTGAITGVPRFDNFNYDRHKTDADKLCPDCKFTCLVWDDRQDDTDRQTPYWTETGTWTTDTANVWHTGTAGAKAICNVPQSRGLNPANVNVTVNPSGGCTTRLYADYLDASNHHCLQVAWTDAGFNKTYQAHVMRVAGGVASAIGSFNGLWTLNGSFPSMHVCIADTAILGVVKSGSLTTVHSGLIPTTLHDGMRTGYSVEAGTAKFTDFQFYRHKSTGDDRGCPDCGVTFKCGGACLDNAPAALKLVLTGINNALCANCGDINGIYVAPLIYSNSQACVYRAQLPLDCKGPNVADNECKIEVWLNNYWRPEISVNIYLTSVEPDIWFIQSPWTANCTTLNNYKMARPSQRTIVCTPAQDAQCLITAL